MKSHVSDEMRKKGSTFEFHFGKKEGERETGKKEGERETGKKEGERETGKKGTGGKRVTQE